MNRQARQENNELAAKSPRRQEILEWKVDNSRSEQQRAQGEE
jgi:hypothetical protein